MIKASEMRKATEDAGDELAVKVQAEIKRLEERIIDAANSGRSETFFTYTQGGTPFNDVRMYEKLKDYFISNGFKIIKYDTKYDGMGRLFEYAKEYISW